MYHVAKYSLRDLLLIWAEEHQEERFLAWQDFVATTKQDVQKLIGLEPNEETISALNAIISKTESFFTVADEPQAVAHYLNNEVPGTWRLVTVHREESPGFATPRNILYHFIWSEPDL